MYWGTSQNPESTGTKKVIGWGLGHFIDTLKGLTSNTTYYVKAFASNSNGTAYGNEVTFKTAASATFPTVTTDAMSNYSTTTLDVGGNVVSEGGATVTEKGVFWSVSHNPENVGIKKIMGWGSGHFKGTIAGLASNTTYYVKAFATNSVGTAYGNEETFKTATSAVLPTVITTEISDVTANSAVSGGNVTSDGYSTITARGVCWNTNENPTILNNKTNNGTGTGTFISNITGLSANTTYYVRAYATNSIGTSYGIEYSFKTKDGIVKLSTAPVTNITSTTATSGGDVTDDGGSPVISRGVCWSINENPTIVNNHTNDGFGAGTFYSNISGLSANTTYYVKAYATNSMGTVYGNQVDFKTTLMGTNNPPVITSSPPTDVDEDVTYSYTLTATDADAGDILTYDVVQIPSWLVSILHPIY